MSNEQMMPDIEFIPDGISKSNVMKVFNFLGAKNSFNEVNNEVEAIEAFGETGIPNTSLNILREKTKLTVNQLAHILNISPSTLNRRIKDKKGKLDKYESQRTFRITKIIVKGEEVFGDKDLFREWLFLNNMALGGKKPLDLLDNEMGVEPIEKLLTRLEYGIYS